jgi:hypothetical protein
MAVVRSFGENRGGENGFGIWVMHRGPEIVVLEPVGIGDLPAL